MSFIISDIADYLATQSLGTCGTNIFKGYLPDSVNECMAVLDTGGLEPDSYLPTKVPTFQVFIRSASYTLGKTKQEAVRTALHRLTNTTLGDNYYFYVLAISEGGHIGKGMQSRGLDEFSMNFRALIR